MKSAINPVEVSEAHQGWSSFQRHFLPGFSDSERPMGTVCLYHGTAIVGVFDSSGERVEWRGKSLQDFEEALALEEPLRLMALDPTPFGAQVGSTAPFLRDFSGWWARVLPVRYGVLLMVSGEPGLLLLMGSGKLETLQQVPPIEFGSGSRATATERRIKEREAIASLQERFGVPIQGVKISHDLWQQWIASGDLGGSEWRALTQGLFRGHVELIPSRPAILGMVGLRGFFGV
jgi:hypothetical protein